MSVTSPVQLQLTAAPNPLTELHLHPQQETFYSPIGTRSHRTKTYCTSLPDFKGQSIFPVSNDWTKKPERFLFTPGRDFFFFLRWSKHLQPGHITGLKVFILFMGSQLPSVISGLVTHDLFRYVSPGGKTPHRL